MGNIIDSIFNWIKIGISYLRDATVRELEIKPNAFELQHYAEFEVDLQLKDLEVCTYDNHIKKDIILRRGERAHGVTPLNLISYRPLNRRERRANKYLRDNTNESNQISS